MDLERGSYDDARAVADGYLVPVPFGPCARVTRRVWDAFADPGGAPSLTLEAARRLWSTADALPPDANGTRILRQCGYVLWLVPNDVGGLTLMFPDDQ